MFFSQVIIIMITMIIVIIIIWPDSTKGFQFSAKSIVLAPFLVLPSVRILFAYAARQTVDIEYVYWMQLSINKITGIFQ